MLRTADTHPWRIADTNWLQVGAQLALAGLWLALFRPVGDYLLMILSHEHYHTNQIMLIGILVLASVGAWIAFGALRRGPTFVGSVPTTTIGFLTLTVGGLVDAASAPDSASAHDSAQG